MATPTVAELDYEHDLSTLPDSLKEAWISALTKLHNAIGTGIGQFEKQFGDQHDGFDYLDQARDLVDEVRDLFKGDA